MTHQPLKKGDPWPFRSSRGLTGSLLDSPVWSGLIVPPQRAHVEVHYPEREVVRHRNGKRYKVKLPMISGVIYARFDALPHWDQMKARRVVSGVFCNGATPVAIPDGVVRQICDLPEIEDELEKARIAAMTPEVGEEVMLKGGLFEGFRVDVVRSESGRVWYEAITDIGKMQGETSIKDVQRLVHQPRM